MTPGTTEAFSRIRIDARLEDAGWNLTDGVSVLFEHALGDGSRADYVLCDRAGRPMAVVEAKRASVDPITAQDQGIHYATLLDVPFVFLSNGEEVRFLDRTRDAHAREIATFYSQDDLERRIAARSLRRALADVPIDRRIVDRGYQIDCIEALSAEVTRGRRKLLVEMATGTGKTRTAAAFIERLFKALWSEVGKRRTSIGWDELFKLKQLFGVSVQALTYRCKELGIFTRPLFRRLFDEFKRRGWRDPPYEEPLAVREGEKPRRFERLCLRALAEGAISEPKAAELLGIPVRELDRRMQEPPESGPA